MHTQNAQFVPLADGEFAVKKLRPDRPSTT